MFANLILDLRPWKDRAAANCVSGAIVNQSKNIYTIILMGDLSIRPVFQSEMTVFEMSF